MSLSQFQFINGHTARCACSAAFKKKKKKASDGHYKSFKQSQIILWNVVQGNYGMLSIFSAHLETFQACKVCSKLLSYFCYIPSQSGVIRGDALDKSQYRLLWSPRGLLQASWCCYPFLHAAIGKHWLTSIDALHTKTVGNQIALKCD